jgi:hypothetical protein
MNKPEYSDLYRFLVSLGTIFVAFSILLPWLLIRESFDSTISKTDYTNLTQTAQILITYRHSIGLWLYQNVIIISILISFLGITIFIYGFFSWRQKQKLTDKKDELEIEKLDKEVKSMTPEQIAIQYVHEVSKESSPVSTKETDTNDQIEAISEYARIEQLAFNKLANCFGINNLRMHHKIENINIDILLRVQLTQRCIFEIKTISSIDRLSWLIDDTQKALEKSIKTYINTTNISEVYGIGLFFISDEMRQLLTEGEKRINLSQKKEVLVKIVLFTEKEFADLDCSKLEAVVLIK